MWHRSGTQKGETMRASERETERGDKAGIGVGNRKGIHGGHRSGTQKEETSRASVWETEKGDMASIGVGHREGRQGDSGAVGS